MYAADLKIKSKDGSYLFKDWFRVLREMGYSQYENTQDKEGILRDYALTVFLVDLANNKYGGERDPLPGVHPRIRSRPLVFTPCRGVPKKA